MTNRPITSNRPGHCSLCLKRFKKEADFHKHASGVHSKRLSEASFVVRELNLAKEPESEWEFYHQYRGWPI